MATTTFQGIVRSNGGAGKGNATPSVVTLSEVISFDPTAASATAVRIGTSSSSGELLFYQQVLCRFFHDYWRIFRWY